VSSVASDPVPPVRVLVVEDHEVIRGVVRLACEHAHGLEVVGEVATGRRRSNASAWTSPA
jgi:DNA-binding NarL/FixJ family response regulator